MNIRKEFVRQSRVVRRHDHVPTDLGHDEGTDGVGSIHNEAHLWMLHQSESARCGLEDVPCLSSFQPKWISMGGCYELILSASTGAFYF